MKVGPYEFREVWAVDFEYRQSPGNRPVPVCLVARELVTGHTIRWWQDDLRGHSRPPYGIGPDALFVAYFAVAEVSCHLALNWPVPSRIMDPYVEFRNRTNGEPPPAGNGLLGALVYHGLPSIEVEQKNDMRQLVLRGGPWTPDEQRAILNYCESDVVALERLLPRMLTYIDVPRALLRGRSMIATARIEHRGIPIDVGALRTLSQNWDSVRDRLIQRVDADFDVYDGRTFKAQRFEALLAARGIRWPRGEGGALLLDADTFREMARRHPWLDPLRQLRVSLSKMRLHKLTVGGDGRNRYSLWPFAAKTGRNQPKSSQSIFGPSAWLRGLIRPEPGYGLAYIDWEQQEFGIAAALSGDLVMMMAYQSGDPYLTFAKQAGAVPADATKETHPAERGLYKLCALGVQYGIGAESLARQIDRSEIEARDLLRRHHQTYPKFWQWSDAAVDYAELNRRLCTVFGWRLRVGTQSSRKLRNFPMQANGAEMLRLACCLATERGVGVCAPVHDAVLIEAPLHTLDDAIATTQAAMAEASRIILSGFELRTDTYVIRYPDRYQTEKGQTMWDTVWELIRETGEETPARGANPPASDTIPAR